MTPHGQLQCRPGRRLEVAARCARALIILQCMCIDGFHQPSRVYRAAKSCMNRFETLFSPGIKDRNSPWDRPVQIWPSPSLSRSLPGLQPFHQASSSDTYDTDPAIPNSGEWEESRKFSESFLACLSQITDQTEELSGGTDCEARIRSFVERANLILRWGQFLSVSPLLVVH